MDLDFPMNLLFRMILYTHVLYFTLKLLQFDFLKSCAIRLTSELRGTLCLAFQVYINSLNFISRSQSPSEESSSGLNTCLWPRVDITSVLGHPIR